MLGINKNLTYLSILAANILPVFASIFYYIIFIYIFVFSTLSKFITIHLGGDILKNIVKR